MKPYTFSGHDTFALRHGWLKKVYDRAIALKGQEDGGDEAGDQSMGRPSDLFDTEVAMATFGVGKNMVRSMRYWSLASSFLRLDEENRYEKTPLSDLIFANDARNGKHGLDPYFESLASVWLLHWEIATNTQMCTTWDFTFSQFAKTIFRKDDLVNAIYAYAEANDWKVAKNSIEKDVTCLIHMYAFEHPTGGISLKEESLESPLAELRLMSSVSAGSGYMFEIGPQKSLPSYVLYYALARYAENRENHLLNLDEIFYDPGSPGRIFKLDEASMCSRLERAAEETNGVIEWQETGPLRQLKLSDTLDATDLLAKAYRKPLAEEEAA
jgi:hypothetical protein